MVSALRRALAAVALLSSAGTALAEPPGESPESTPSAIAPPNAADGQARSAFDAGVKALVAKRWTDAERQFRQSAALVRKPTTLYNLAVALYKQGRHHECSAVLDEVLKADDAELVRHAVLLRERAQTQFSVLRLVVSPPDAQVRIDGSLVRGAGAERTLEITPGRHEAEVAAAGYTTQRLTLVSRAHTDLERSISLEHSEPAPPALPAAPARRQTNSGGGFFDAAAPWITIGVGGALLAAGAITGLVALRADDDLKQKCPTNQNCDPAHRELRDRTLRLGRAADVLLVSGTVVVVGGVTWRVLIPTSSSSRVTGFELTLTRRY